MIYIIPTIGSVVLVLKTVEHKRDFAAFLKDALGKGCGTQEVRRLFQLLDSHLKILSEMPGDMRAMLKAAEAEDRRRVEREDRAAA